MIVFPLAMPPAPPIFDSVKWKPVTQASLAQSPFTGQQQAQLNQGEWLAADLTLPKMTRSQAEAWITFRLKLRGRYGTFLFGPVGGEAKPRGSGAGAPAAASAGSPTVNGAGATLLYTKGWTHGAAGVLKAGDWFSIGSGSNAELHKALVDVNADSGGLANFDIFPRLRNVITDGAALTLANPTGNFRMMDNNMEWDLEIAQNYGMAFAIVEALGVGPASL